MQGPNLPGTVVAPHAVMNRIFKLFALGTILLYAAARLRRRTGASAHTETITGADAPGFTGISDVDPEPLTQFGEAVDPDLIRDAHAEPVLPGQLPHPGKNLP